MVCDVAVTDWRSPAVCGSRHVQDRTIEAAPKDVIGSDCQSMASLATMAMNVKTRNISLTPEIDAFIAGRLASGRFNSASEVVRAALRLLEEEERRREMTGSDQAGRVS